MNEPDIRDRPGFAYPIRTCDRDDEPALLDLLRHTVGETAASQKTTSFWRWKHARNPFGASYSVCATNPLTAEMVGLRTLMWWRLRHTGQQPVHAVRPVDTATHPDHQRRGIFSALTRYAIADLEARGVPFIFNTPNENSLPGYLKLGWSVVARFPIYVRPVRFGSIARAALKPAETRSPWPDHATGLVSWNRFRERHEADLSTLVADNEASRRQVGYRTARDLAYLDWRYGQHPDIEYSVYPSYERNGLAGIVIGRIVPGARGMPAFVITEMLLRTPGRRASVRLLRSLTRAEPGAYLMAHFARGTWERQALMLWGFVRAPGRGYTVAARPLNPALEDPTRPRAWDLTLGELEIF
jgi:GNAT superfamily N-acetyltransferase